MICDMRKMLLLIALLTGIFMYTVQAQTNVVSTPQHRNAVLEEFT
jgi:hypothetical protein